MPSSSKKKAAASESGDMMSKVKIGVAVVLLLAGVFLILKNFNLIGPDPATAKLPPAPPPTEGLSEPDKKVYEQLQIEQAENLKKHPPAGS
ncbi:MAG: hypothetical protein WC718_01050 [Phycisphaerales bacterium]|jgi:hypothetical protein